MGAYCKPHSTCFFIIAMVIIKCNLASSTLSKAHCLFLTATLLELLDSAVLFSGSMETQRTVFIPCFSFYPSRLFPKKRWSECIQLNWIFHYAFCVSTNYVQQGQQKRRHGPHFLDKDNETKWLTGRKNTKVIFKSLPSGSRPFPLFQDSCRPVAAGIMGPHTPFSWTLGPLLPQ